MSFASESTTRLPETGEVRSRRADLDRLGSAIEQANDTARWTARSMPQMPPELDRQLWVLGKIITELVDDDGKYLGKYTAKSLTIAPTIVNTDPLTQAAIGTVSSFTDLQFWNLAEIDLGPQTYPGINTLAGDVYCFAYRTGRADTNGREIVIGWHLNVLPCLET